MFRRTPRGAYTGRLAFDCDNGYHIDGKGRPIVTDDGGKSWRYATAKDDSHQARYQRNAIVVKGTTGEDLHDAAPTVDDPHYERVLFTTDDTKAAVETSHTDAWK